MLSGITTARSGHAAERGTNRYLRRPAVVTSCRYEFGRRSYESHHPVCREGPMHARRVPAEDVPRRQNANGTGSICYRCSVCSHTSLRSIVVAAFGCVSPSAVPLTTLCQVEQLTHFLRCPRPSTARSPIRPTAPRAPYRVREFCREQAPLGQVVGGSFQQLMSRTSILRGLAGFLGPGLLLALTLCPWQWGAWGDRFLRAPARAPVELSIGPAPLITRPSATS